MPQTTTDTLQSLSDSVAGPVVSEQPPTSLFEGHLLPPSEGIAPEDRSMADNGFIFIVLLLCVAIAAYLQLNSDRLFPSIFKAGFDRNLALQDARIENSQRIRNLFIAQVVALLSISLFITGALSRILLPVTDHSGLFLKVLGIFTVAVLTRRLIMMLLSRLFGMSAVFRLQRYNLTVFLTALGLLLLPVTVLFFFVPSLSPVVPYHIGMVLIGFFYLKGLLRGLMLAIGQGGASLLHLFYYLCALEILPLFILVRFVRIL